MAAYRHHTLEEIVEMLKKGKQPLQEDLLIIAEYFEKLIALKNFANAVQDANHFL